jgi:TRAP-type C4-dicarboxylate transport system substrate-binding protein
MKKRWMGMVVVFVAAFGMLFVVSATAQQAKPVVEINHATDIDGKIVVEWFKEIETRTNGRVKGNVFAGGALGKGPEIIGLLRSGAAASGTVGVGFTKDFAALDYLDCPFRVSGAEQGSQVAYGLYKNGYLDKDLKNLNLMFMTATAPFHLFTAKKAITNLNDLKGMKIRVSGPASAASIKALGGIPVSVPPSELYMAVEKGTVDGFVASMGLVEGSKTYEVVKYALWEPLGVGVLINILNGDVWKKVSAQDQAAINEINTRMAKRYTDYHVDTDRQAVKFLTDKGIKVNNLPADERTKWTNIVNEVRDKGMMESWTAAGLPADKLMKDATEINNKTKK